MAGDYGFKIHKKKSKVKKKKTEKISRESRKANAKVTPTYKLIPKTPPSLNCTHQKHETGPSLGPFSHVTHIHVQPAPPTNCKGKHVTSLHYAFPNCCIGFGQLCDCQ